MSDNVLLIPHIRVQNANALSSPFTVGFPAMTAWLGAVHALQRKLNSQGVSASFDAVGVVSHQFDLQTYKGPGDYEYSIIGTGNPLEPKSQKGKPKGNAERPSFIEEARCHLDVSLLVQCSQIDKMDEPEIIEKVSHNLNSRMKMAGGDILGFNQPQFFKHFETLKFRLMPGYALIERRELMVEAMQNGQDALDALLDYLSIHHNCEQQGKDGDGTVTWTSKRKSTGSDEKRGWIVPIATGFHGISEPGQAKNQRDSNPDIPHRFAEAVVTLGEFKMPYKIGQLEELLWRYHYDMDNNLYLCKQTKTDSHTLLEQRGF